MDTDDVQFNVQDFYFKFKEILDNGECVWEKVCLNKKRIVWINPNNGFSIAALKDLDFEITMPNCLPTYEENFESFKSLWIRLEYDLDLFYENIESHHRNQEYCCLDCSFPFSTVCLEVYTKFEPDPS